jgi:DNA-binding CsgD family transcriptional regulator
LVHFAWPLTGRSEEMRIVDAAISSPDSSGIVVCGAAGVGKSRIAREALSTAARRGCDVRWVVGTSSARALPLGAFAACAPSAVTDQLELVRSVIDAVTASSPGAVVALGVDDVHLLDDLSTFVLHQIIHRRAAKVVLTIRDGDPISAATQELWGAGQFDRLDLQPLSRNEATTLLSATLGAPVDPDAETRLWKLTRGNVLYLRNIVEQEVGDGRLVRQRGYWRWNGEPVLPRTLIETIESRIGALPSAVGEVIDAVAVGEPVELQSLTRITDHAAVEEAESRGLITLDRAGKGVEVRAAHPLYAEVRRRRTASSKLRRLRGLIVTELAAGDHDDMRTVVRRATLSLDSDLKPDAELLVAAAQGAVWLADLPLAERLADAAIHAGGIAEANFVRAHALSWLSRGAEADAALVEMPTAGFADADRARVAFLRATNMLWTLADPDGAKDLIDAAAPATGEPAQAGVNAFLTEYWAAMGQPEQAIESSKTFTLDQLPNTVGAVTAWAIVVASGDSGRIADAVAAAEAGYAIVSRSYDASHMRFVIADGHIGALVQSGRIAEANEAAERLRGQAAELPGAALLFSGAVTGRAALGAGRLDAAVAVLAPAVEILTGSGETNGWSYRYQLSRVTALAISGSTDEAEAGLTVLDELRHPSWRCLDHEYGLARAWVAAAQGAVSEAVDLALFAAQTARANAQFAAEVMCLQAATQFGDSATANRLRELTSIVDGPRVRIAARFAAALSANDGPELAASSEDFERIGDLVGAIDAAALAAIAYRRRGLYGSAYGCAARAAELARQAGGASTPALRRSAERSPLTDREQEVVMLIANGLSNRELAERLKVSVRTIEGHIYRAMGKTGTANRDELASLLPRNAAQ